MSIGRLFLVACLKEGVSSFAKFGKIDHLFKAGEVAVYDFIKTFVHKHATMPKLATVEKHTSEEFEDAPEPSSYYHDLLQERYIEQELKKSMKEAEKLFQPATKDPHGALGLISETVMQLIAQRFQMQVVDFRTAHDLIMAEYQKEYAMEESDRLLTGWPTVDEMCNGFSIGDMISLVGRPGKGKTWSALFSAMHGWRDRIETITKKDEVTNQKVTKKVSIKGQSRMFVAMEMGPLAMQQRMTAIEAKIKYNNLDKASMSTTSKLKMKNKLLEIAGYGAPFWVVDGNLTSTVDDIEMMARQLKPHAIYIDGGYLLQHENERDLYRRVGVNANLIKQKLCALAPTFVSWQFARSAAKKNKKKGEKVDLEDIGSSDVIGQVSSAVLALLDKDTAESLVQRRMDILKGRKGEVGDFVINWDFGPKMDFSEYVEPDVGELKFG